MSNERPKGRLDGSRHGQDRWVLGHLDGKREGYFVELGAYDGIIESNTHLMESEYGWTGICIEAIPSAVRKLKQNRTCTIVDSLVGDKDGAKVPFVITRRRSGIYFEGEGCNAAIADRKDNAVMMTTKTMNTILGEAGCPARFDYFSLDVEGYEREVLRGMDFTRFRPRVVTIERNFPDDTAAMMEANGYDLVHHGKADDHFVDRGE